MAFSLVVNLDTDYIKTRHFKLQAMEIFDNVSEEYGKTPAGSVFCATDDTWLVFTSEKTLRITSDHPDTELNKRIASILNIYIDHISSFTIFETLKGEGDSEMWQSIISSLILRGVTCKTRTLA